MRKRRLGRLLPPICLFLLAALLLTSLKAQYPAELEAVYFVEGQPARVSLTFETLWSGSGVEQVLEILQNEDVRATFFISGAWLEANPDTAGRILAYGHEIGNHTLNHRVMLYLDNEAITKEIKGFNEMAAEILEYRPRVFRPPLGLYNGAVIKKAKQMGCRTVLWSIESYDWTSRESETIVRQVMDRLHGGAVITFRAGAPLLLEALPLILEELKTSGYEAVPVSELLDQKR